MLRGIILAGLIFIGSMLWLHRILVNGTALQYLDAHQNPRWVPTAEFYIGKGYYIFQSLPEAATYFIRIPERYPTSPYAEDAYFNYLETLDDTLGLSRQVLIEEYQKYLEKYPEGSHASIIRDRIDIFRTSGR